MIINKERQLVTSESIKSFLDRGDKKKAIIYLSGAVLGTGIAKVVSVASPIVDKFLFYDIPNFLNGSKYVFMGYFPIPNWFIVCCLFGYLVMAFATIYFNIKRA